MYKRQGLDIVHVTHIFNFDLPREGPEIYVHRIGRTSRMENEGKAISLATHDQLKMLREIENFMKKPIQRLYFSDNQNITIQSKSKRSSSSSRTKKKSSNFNGTKTKSSSYGGKKKKSSSFSETKTKSSSYGGKKKKSSSFSETKTKSQLTIHASD